MNLATENGRPPGGQGVDLRRGIIYMCLGVTLCFPVMNALAKLLMESYAIPQVIWARFAGHLVVMILFFGPRHGWGLLRTKHPAIQLARSALIMGATVFYFIALHFISQPTVAVIGFTGPLVVVILSIPILGEQVGARRWAAVFAGFVGAVIIIRPGLGVMHWAAILVLGTAFCYGFYQVLTRRISGADAPETSNFYTALVGFLVLSAVLPFDFSWPQNGSHLAAFAGLGTLGAVGHYFVVRAYEFGPASVISPFGYFQLIGATVVGYGVFGDFPDTVTWLGAAVIVVSGLYIIHREAVQQ
ncbi:MAG TPA: DMT family transporter [Alphaproteobacteria bacterium]|jgi:drug/metabolite transporter (DMT)-like permease|nr:DMT family transporter [Alphaproteobacteria bacterium]MDP6272265.1 DMT family transporter [Alphaproteobacteria bacterium]MDP7427445.1 DMT family transporter [Alphaproteobacteria bacterium]HJM51320.1 DMT family transporter [Alphaproteobacteria bacterium]